MKFTTDQQRVIDERDKNILVSAAAGSGKTAVLVERIISLITNADRPVDIDRLLIVTFTSAAAAEMRERISLAIADRLEKEPENEHLQKQATLLHNAQITTIHSFCLNVIRNNFNEIHLDPGFRTADEGEMALLLQDAMDELLEQKFEEKDADFIHCVECYSTGGKEKNLEEQILKLYRFSESYPDPKGWLLGEKSAYLVKNEEEFLQSDVMQFLGSYTESVLTECKILTKQALTICTQDDGPYMYQPAIESDLALLQGLQEKKSYTDLYLSLFALEWQTLSRKSDTAVEVWKKEAVKELRDSVKKILKKLKEKYYFAPMELILSRTQYCSRALNTILDLTISFADIIYQKKREKNIIDFGDMEHLALQILTEHKDGELIPSKTARDYQEFFYEIMCDEYQDSNLIQETILTSVSGMESGRYNRFMVGDVKQSIYKFRLARPEIFMEKYHQYAESSAQNERIDLSMNFRSRKEVLDSINFIFRQIMCREMGGIDYDEKAALYVGADYYPEETHNETELLLIEKPGEEEDDNAKQREAMAIALRIKELLQTTQVYDKNTGGMRPASYKDIVILLRSNKGWDEEFKKVLDAYGIPCYCTSKSGYFDTTEIRNVMQLLRIIDNPLQDIPLFGAMKSPFGNFTDEEMAILSAYYREKNDNPFLQQLYYGLLSYAEEKTDQLSEKVSQFLTFLRKWRDKACYMPIRELLQELLNETGYKEYVSALPGGEQRKANIELLLQKAAAFEKTSYFGTFHFLRYLEQIMEKEVEYGEADILDENADVVRIMSIHKSKGLEFPICIVAGLGKKYNMADTTKTIVTDPVMGIGTDYINEEKRLISKTLRKNVIARKMAMDNLAEEIRVLYVALTRAKEKLIMTGMVASAEKAVNEVHKYCCMEPELLSFIDLSEETTALGYILKALARSKAMDALYEAFSLSVNPHTALWQESPKLCIKIVDGEAILQKQVKNELQETMSFDSFIRKAAAQTEDGFAEKITEKFNWQYAHLNLEKLFNKTTVSELKMAHIEKEAKETGVVPLFHEPKQRNIIPRFMAEQEETSGTTRGSAFHKVMELLPLQEIFAADINHENVQKVLEGLVETGALTSEYAKLVNVDKVILFLHSTLAKRMAEAEKTGKLYREQPFVYGILADRLNKEFPATETILVQGIIDVYFEENNQIYVADYKTDQVKSKEELIDRYQVQLDYYSEALEKMTGKKVADRMIYSFGLGIEFSL